MSNFFNDLKFGNFYMNEFIKIKGWKEDTYKVMKGKFAPYDLIHYRNGKEFYYEVKADKKAFKTNNLCIEYEYSGKPSGISISEAHYYIYFVVTDVGYDLYKIPSKDLKEMIKNKEYHIKLFGGDGKQSKFYLFSLDIFEPYKI